MKDFLCYAEARAEEYHIQRSYQIYMTDALKAAYKLNIRWADRFKPEETRSAEEIIDSISNGLAKIGR